MHSLRIILACILCTGTALAADLSPIRADGTRLVDRDGKPVTLRGCNLGNWFVFETWMMHWSSARDHYEVEQVLSERFGKDQKDRWLDQYRAAFMQDRDWDLIKRFNMNCVRLPLHYNQVLDDEAPYRVRKDAFVWIDRTVDAAERHGIYLLPDLHAAPGAQSKDHNAGRADQNRLWSDPECQQATIEFWRAMAKRYRGRPVIAGWDILNEPYGDYRTNLARPMNDLARKVYDAIRESDPDRIIFLPGIIHGGIRIYDGQIADMKQVGLTQHHYPGIFGDQGSLKRMSWFLHQEMADLDAFMAKMNRPLLVGEFQVPLYESGGPYMLRLHFDRYAQSGWAATSWSYKILKPEPGAGDGTWYMVTNAAPLPRIDLKKSTKEEIDAYVDAVGRVELTFNPKLHRLLTTKESPDLPLDLPPQLPTAAPTDSARAPWTAADVGGGRAGGQTLAPDGTITITAAGTDIYGARDSFRFLSQPATADCTITATVTDLLESARYAKAGIMLRTSDAPDSAHAMLNIFPDATIALCNRPAAGDQTREQKFHAGPLPITLRLARTGDTVTASFAGEDGHWTTAGQTKLPGPARAGLAVTSHTPAQLTRATFKNVSLVVGPQGPESQTPSTNVQAPAAQELLQNPSFDTHGPAPDRAAAWERWGDWMNREDSWTPTRTGRALIGYHHWQMTSASNSGLWQDATVEKGKRYTFSISVSQDPAKDSKPIREIELALEATLDGKQAVITRKVISAPEIATSPQWSRIALTATAPTDTMRVLIRITPSPESPRGGAVKLDDASLKPAAP